MDSNIRCFWCGSYKSETSHVRVNEDVPPRWLSGEKKVKKSNCVPQCKECQNALAMLDDAVMGYFKSGVYKDMDKIEKNISFLNNKGIYARKIILNGKIDYAQSNGNLLLWLRKLLAGLWYKQYNKYFNSGMYILSHWLSFDDPDRYFSNTVTPTERTLEILFNIDEKIADVNYYEDCIKKVPFVYKFFSPSECGIPKPFQLLRFAIYGSYAGYCLYLPEITEIKDKNILKEIYWRSPFYFEYWLKGYHAFSSSDVIKLVNSTKLITAEEAAKRVRVNNLGDFLDE